MLLVAITASVIPAGFGQTLSLGVVGGSSLTSDYGGTGTTIYYGPPPNGTATFTTSTSRHAFIVGPKLELAFPGRISIEVDVLRRRRQQSRTAVFDPPVSFGSTLVSSDTWRLTDSHWEVPLLVKYRLPISSNTPLASPFIEVGPSLRPWLYAGGSARAGITGGVGLQLRLGSVRVEPTIRYTRWGDQRFNFTPVRPKSDQLEFLVGVAGASSSVRPSVFGQKLSIGVLGGFGLSGDFPATVGYASARSKIVGLTLESSVSKHMSVEFDALYCPRVLSEGQRATVLTWEFPFLAKYRFFTPRLNPFLELGPSFRAAGNTNGTNPSRYGITAGAGIETKVHRLRIAPAIRYTYWTADPPGPMSPASTIRNQVALLVGFLL